MTLRGVQLLVQGSVADPSENSQHGEVVAATAPAPP